MTDVRAYLRYFQNLAQWHNDLHDFYVMDINEPLQALRGSMQFPALIMNSLSGSFVAPNLDNTLDEVKGGFLVLGRLDNVDDFSGEMLLLQHMKQIGQSIFSRMNHDLLTCEPRALKAILGFNINSVSYQMVDGIFDNCFGFLFSFRIHTKLDLSYNPLQWSVNNPKDEGFEY
ncbi:MAG: hypothetical protein Q8M08_17440 [Bacteroidales bacterium]|nr:hypothetical protein [Bacteroidales bacterium]